ncbi:hypothetical protein WDW37_06345 [Bdellovibrionota bacterium FG-1]
MSLPKIRGVVTFSSKGRRPAQEDHLLSIQDKGIFVVADGFGGPLPGSTAAQTACEAIKGFLIKEAGDLDATLPFELRSYYSLAGNVLFNALIHANRKVKSLNHQKGIHERGGASVLAGYLDGDLLALANVGACTGWLMRQGKIVDLVIPRTYGRLCDPFLTEHREDHQIPLMALGLAEQLEPEIFEYRVRKGDWVVFQTDGLPLALRSELAREQGGELSTEEASERVLVLLGQREYIDNTSVLLVIF